MRTRYSKPIARGAPPARAGFSLVELLIVIAVIVLLVGILTPSLYKARSITYNTRSKAALHELSAGALAFQKDTGYYPGQQYVGLLDHYTGSQLLAACVYGLSLDGSGSFNDVQPTSKYVSFKTERVMEVSASGIRAFVPSDLFPDPMPILYYPSRLGNDGTLGNALGSGAFRYNDNADLTGSASNPGETREFCKAIWDKRFGTVSTITPPNITFTDRAYKSDSFLLIGAGIDRKFFTADDVTNFKQ